MSPTAVKHSHSVTCGTFEYLNVGGDQYGTVINDVGFSVCCFLRFYSAFTH